MAGASFNVVYLSDLLPEDIERLQPIKRVKAEDIIVSPNVENSSKVSANANVSGHSKVRCNASRLISV